MAKFTPTQGRYLAYISNYTNLHGYPPAESEIAAAICVSPPSVNTMVRMLEKKGLIDRQPGQARSIKVRVPYDEIPPWNGRKRAENPFLKKQKTNDIATVLEAPPANLYVLTDFLYCGPMSEKFQNKRIYRKIEIRGDQTLDDLHRIIFQAYDRRDEHLYQFQFGKRANDPNGPNYGISNPHENETEEGDARTTMLDDLDLKVERVFGYLFDFGDNWFHHIQVDRIDKAIPTVRYPRIVGRVGKSPPQYSEE